LTRIERRDGPDCLTPHCPDQNQHTNPVRVANANVPLLTVYHFGTQIHRIVTKELLNFLRPNIMLADVIYVRLIPVENQVVRHQVKYTYIVRISRLVVVEPFERDDPELLFGLYKGCWLDR
jgi:hypothetical protein